MKSNDDPDLQLVGSLIVVTARETARLFNRALTTKSKLSASEVEPWIRLELCALYLHLFDREVAVRLSADLRALFNRALFCCAVEHLESEGPPYPPFSGSDFRQFYDDREQGYSAYKDLLPAPGKSTGGTLFWEFGKRVGLRYQGYNPVALQVFILAAVDGYIALRKALEDARVQSLT